MEKVLALHYVKPTSPPSIWSDFEKSCPEIIDKVHIFSKGHSNVKKSPNFYFNVTFIKFKKVGRFFQKFWLSQNIYFDVFTIFIYCINFQKIFIMVDKTRTKEEPISIVIFFAVSVRNKQDMKPFHMIVIAIK